MLFFNISYVAQGSETVLLSEKLHWNTNSLGGQGSGLITFDGATIDQQFGNLPYVIHRQRLRGFGVVDQIRWIKQETMIVPSGLQTRNSAEHLQSDWQIHAEVSDGGGIPYLVVILLPLRQSGAGVEGLTEYELELTIEYNPRSNTRSLSFASQSVLSEGTWFKIATARDGIYKIDKVLLSQLGINSSTLNPQQFNVYGNGGTLLPEDNSVDRYDDLQKCSIYYSGSPSSSVFSDNDYFLFYAKGPDKWSRESSGSESNRWKHVKHYYSDSAYYFIRIDDIQPKRIQPASLPQQPATHTVTTFQDYQFIENDIYNLIQSGRTFYGDLFDNNTSGQYQFQFPNISTSHSATLDVKAAIRSVGGVSSMVFSAGGQSQTLSGGPTGTDSTSPAATDGSTSISFMPTTSPVSVQVQLNKYSNTADVKGYIDYLRMNVTRMLVLTGNQMKFRDTTMVAQGNIGQFELSNIQSSTRVWDITDITTPQLIEMSVVGNMGSWKYATEMVHEFIAFNGSGYLTPVAAGKVANQNLHGAQDIDLVIVSAPGNMAAAEALAQLHAEDGLSVLLTNTLAVFNEFSSGNPDVIAIRMLMKMLYDRANGDPQKMPQNLLLFGDGDYARNKGINAFTGSNVIVFETNESVWPIISSVSDDYFVFLSDQDNGAMTNSLDAGVGRICASNGSEAMTYVNKVKAYKSQNTLSNGASCTVCEEDEAQTPFGNWRNNLIFVSDDQDGSGGANEQEHFANSEIFANYLRTEHPEYDLTKIYLDAYKQEVTPGGERYPEAEEAIRYRVQNGALLVTYIGHGGEKGWAHERVLDENTITGWTNLYRMPVFLTATCELARYDYAGYKSAGEKMVMNPKGGAIAMLTTTRVVFSFSNKQIDEAFFNVALRETEIENLTLGKINMLTKNGVSGDNRSRSNFSLLGDPALRLAYPKFEVYTSHINGIEITSFTDTLKALQEVEVQGYVADDQGQLLSQFDGFVYPTVYDKQTKVYTQNNDGGVVQEFNTFNRIIFKGRATVKQGKFTFKYIIPYDINYSVGKGRISYYAVAGNEDAHGYDEHFNIGSALSNIELNKVGPEVELFLNDSTFVNGGITDKRPYLLARLKDENGINTVGNGVGHDITMTLDNNVQNPVVLNDYYQADLDTYKSGMVKYQLQSLKEGNHTLTLKAWDVHNNSSVATLEFIVTEDSEIALKQVLNYPNPFTTHTSFMFEHNQSCETLDVRIQIFTISGKLVKTITQTARQNGFRTEPIAWDGRDDFGDRIGKGVYVYKVEIRNKDGQSAEQYEKLVILK